MDHSLRTVATQLLNVTNSEEVVKANDKNYPIDKKNLPKVVSTIDVETRKTMLNDNESLKTNFNNVVLTREDDGSNRSTNSKLGYFETSHPGQAMALTEEELEKEIALTRDMMAYKTHPTTSGGISTWILLNLPSSTPKTMQEKERPENDFKSAAKPTASIEKVDATLKNKQKPTGLVEKVGQTQVVPEKMIQKHNKSGLINLRKSSTPKPPQGNNNDMLNRSQQIEDVQKNSTTVTSDSLTKNDSQTTQKPTVTTKNPTVQSRTTLKSKVTDATTTWRPSMVKIIKPNFNRPKSPTRPTTLKYPGINIRENVLNSKIEKVTFKPVHMIFTQINETRTERPTIVTKVKASVLTEVQKTTTNLPPLMSTGVPKLNNSKSNFSGSDLVEIPVKVKPTATKFNNVLKVQLRKPAPAVQEVTEIEIEPIKVNAPVLNIEKIDENTKKAPKIDEASESGDQKILDNSYVDLKLDFNPESMQTEFSTEMPSVSSTTKKFRRGPNKRKKNKVRRRKPSKVTSTTAVSTMDIQEVFTEVNVHDNSIPQAKTEPEMKMTNSTKTKKKKQVQKPISTQIYNYLSREIMPSFGVMSLVGLGLGLASYFLYPFGGTITRRNYDVEPNYKYNLDEYGGNYGQNEEEVFSKVLQGMTNHGAKYGGIKDFQDNYYRYQNYDGEQVDSKNTRKKSDQVYSTSSDPTYDNLKNAHDFGYKNTEFKYPEVPVTSNYYERQKQAGIMVGNEEIGNRRFVVGNVPTEPSAEEKTRIDQKSTSYIVNENDQTPFEHELAHNHNNFPKNPVSYGQTAAQTMKVEDGYEEIEITPTAVAVEHGPRALKIRRFVDDQDSLKIRSKRDSVIQMIPPNEMKDVEQEEDLSNEIFGIIDFMIPGGEIGKKMKHDKGVNKIDETYEAKEKKRHDEKTETSQKEFIEVIPKSEEAVGSNKSTTSKFEGTIMISSMTESTSTSTDGQAVLVSKSEEFPSEGTTEPDLVDLEDTTIDWFDSSTTEKVEVPVDDGFNIFTFMRKLAEVKFRLGLTILKHASEGFARYLGHIQKRINGDE